MDQQTSHFHSCSQAQSQSKTFRKSLIISDFGRSWLKLEEKELECAKLTPESVDFTLSFQEKLEFCGLLEATGSDGYIMINCSIRLKNDADDNVQDECMGTVDCKCLMEAFIPQTSLRNFYAKGSFQNQIHNGNESTGSVRFMAKEYIDKVATKIKIEL